MAFGILVQRVLPDPQVENTIKIVVQAKRAVEEDEKIVMIKRLMTMD